MNSIDERIKRELEAESLDVDQIIGETGDVNQMFRDALRGSTGGTVKIVIGLATSFFLVAVYCVWEFLGAASVQDQVFWGVWSVLSGVTVISFELWAWMEINRASTMRGITRLELAIRDKKPILSENDPSLMK